MDFNIEEQPQDQIEVKRAKSRNLDIFDFFKILQLEAIVAELRSKIYPKIKDKDYWKKVYEHKKQTVLNIAERNQVSGMPLPSIFTDSDILNEYQKEVYGDGGFPKFLYKDKDNEYQQGFYDHINYYSKDVKVACKYFDDIKIGKVKYYQPNSKKVTVIIDDNNVELDIKYVTRIL